ncbi:hypothetical protein [Niastella sp. OAS944]|uniref:hypothetical protein n=1 Tax=Niastella sp. OAS944 TaxID=2664089 RepID=UPI00347384EC|nr:hypothetical protein [Chitinophagaceae bacterium OAS944]
MKRIFMPLMASGICIILLSACKSTKTPQARPNLTEATSKCDQPIKYYSEKIRSANGQETSFNTEVTINPLNKLINLVSEPPNQDKVAFTVVIESIDCNFNADHTVGQALYHGYINQKDGTTTKIILKLEANDGILTISQGNPEEKGDYVIIISKWEIVHE